MSAAHEYFCAVRRDARRMKVVFEEIERMRDAALGSCPPDGMPRAKGPRDYTAAIDDVLDAERDALVEYRELVSSLADARSVIRGVAETFDGRHARALLLHYVRDHSYKDMSIEMCEPRSTVQYIVSSAVDWCDYKGLSRMREAGAESSGTTCCAVFE